MRRRLLLLVLTICVVILGATPAAAQQQEKDGDGDVQIEFETGDFDGERGDWSISVVHVTGSDLDAGQPLTLELKTDDGAVLWSDTEPASATTTSFTVVPFVAVQDVFRAAVSQPVPEVAGDVVDRQEVEVRRQGAGGGGGGTIALSMVLAVVLMAILFRTPLPSQVSQRWTK